MGQWRPPWWVGVVGFCVCLWVVFFRLERGLPPKLQLDTVHLRKIVTKIAKRAQV